MKLWFLQNRKQIAFGILFCIFVIQVLIVPSIRPFFYEGRNYYITYRIDGNNNADAVVFIPLSFMMMGFFTTLLRHPSRIKTALICALIPLPVVLRRMTCWNAYDSVLDNALYNLCSFALGILLAVFLRFVIVSSIRCIRESWRRYLQKKSGYQNCDCRMPEQDRRGFSVCIQQMLTWDNVFSALSMIVPLILLLPYHTAFAEADPIGIARNSLYMVIVLPMVYALGGVFCGLEKKPQYWSCGAVLLLVSADTIYVVFSIQDYPDLAVFPIAVVVYLLFFGIGMSIGWLIRRCKDSHKRIKNGIEHSSEEIT